MGGDESLKNEIQDMVMKLIQPRHRLIVCLEQSTVEWANTVSRPIAKQIDPDFSRTSMCEFEVFEYSSTPFLRSNVSHLPICIYIVLINTKFDNRVKELRNRDSAEKYLSGENLPAGCKPFFISMPLRRNMESGRFKVMIIIQDKTTLLIILFSLLLVI